MKKICTSIILLALLLAARTQGAWNKKADFLGTKRWGAVAFSIGNKGYLGLGNDGANKKDFWQWDQATNTWTQKADFGGVARYQAVAFAIGDKGYIGTGAAGAAFPYSPLYKDFWQYDTLANTWSPKASLEGSVRFGSVAFSVGGKGYIATGFNDTTYFLKDVWQYDPSLDKWTQMHDFAGTERMEAVGFAIGSKGYLGTGGNYSSGTLFKDFWEYDATTDHWTAKENFGGTTRSTAVGIGTNAKGYIGIGGDFASVTYSDFWEYDPATGHWTAKESFGGTARWLSTGFAIGNRAYIATGGNFAPTYKDLWEYNPGALSTNEFENDANVSIFPNPSKGVFTLTCSGNKVVSAEVYDIKGAKVFRSVIQSNENTIDIASQPAGMYFLNINTEDGIVFRKIVISK